MRTLREAPIVIGPSSVTGVDQDTDLPGVQSQWPGGGWFEKSQGRAFGLKSLCE